MKKKELIELINNYKPKYLYRRKDGYIDKFEVINENTLLHLQTGIASNSDEIILLGKISENIIDLIECGDYVNGKEVKHIAWFEGVPDYPKLIFADEHRLIPGETAENDDIKSIVTKEQYNSMKYIVGGE